MLLHVDSCSERVFRSCYQANRKEEFLCRQSILNKAATAEEKGKRKMIVENFCITEETRNASVELDSETICGVDMALHAGPCHLYPTEV